MLNCHNNRVIDNRRLMSICGQFRNFLHR